MNHMDPSIIKKTLDKLITSTAPHSSLADIAETDEQELLRSISFTEKMFPDWIIMLCRATHKKFRYISPKCREVFGYTDDDINRDSGDFFMQQIHPNDIEAVVACFKNLVSMANEISDPLAYRFILNYRFRISNGQYIEVQDEKFSTTSHNGKLIGFTMLRDVSSLQQFADVRLKTYQKNNNRFILINEYIPVTGTKEVTARETDVLNLLQEGFSTKEIANRLSLSANTVRNHRRSLFQKANVRNRQELMTFARLRIPK
jgi:DNA-binding CsgD family transcriptional regulator